MSSAAIGAAADSLGIIISDNVVKLRALSLLLCFLMLSGCSGLIFYPLKPHVRSPKDIQLDYRDVTFSSTDGVSLHGWFLPAKGKSAGTVVFLHGNAENISTHVGSVYWLPDRGFNVFLFDYRGYGKSSGAPTIPGVHKDMLGALAYVFSQAGVDPERIVVLGQSLGGAIAVTALAQSPYCSRIKALVVESTFVSYRDIFREKAAGFWLTWFFQYPISWTVTDAYSPIKAVKKISPTPFLVIHGDRDVITPIHHGRRLYEAAAMPKEFWLVKGGRHTQAFSRQAFRDRLVNYLDDILEVKGALSSIAIAK